MNKLVLETLELLAGMVDADILPVVYERRAREVLKAWRESLKESPALELPPEAAVGLEDAARMSEGELLKRIKLTGKIGPVHPCKP